MLGIEALLDRKPRALSGGQRQRVALGRALVREPQVFLMDEPLSNLDAKLRAQTRSEIRRLQREVGTTTVYVTHDQVEAMTMGDRIATMRDGVLEQVGDPDSVYEQPANTFVASFIGSPAMSLARVGCERRNGAVGAACSASCGSRVGEAARRPGRGDRRRAPGAHAAVGLGGRAARADRRAASSTSRRSVARR